MLVLLVSLVRQMLYSWCCQHMDSKSGIRNWKGRCSIPLTSSSTTRQTLWTCLVRYDTKACIYRLGALGRQSRGLEVWSDMQVLKRSAIWKCYLKMIKTSTGSLLMRSRREESSIQTQTVLQVVGLLTKQVVSDAKQTCNLPTNLADLQKATVHWAMVPIDAIFGSPARRRHSGQRSSIRKSVFY